MISRNDSFFIASTEIILVPGMSRSELDAEIALLHYQNQRLTQFVERVSKGVITRGEADEIYDMLIEDGIEPYDFLDNAIHSTYQLLNSKDCA